MKFSEWLRGAMADLGWSQNEVARRSGVPQPTITRLLAGSDPKEGTIGKIRAAVEPHLSSKGKAALAETERPAGSPPPAPGPRGFDPSSVENPFARIEEALGDLLILDGERDEVLGLIRAKYSKILAIHRAILEREHQGRRVEDKGPPDDIADRRGSGFATFEGYTLQQTPAHYSVAKKEVKK